MKFIIAFVFSFLFLSSTVNAAEYECDEVSLLLNLCDNSIKPILITVKEEQFTEEFIKSYRSELQNFSDIEKGIMARKLIALAVELISPDNGVITSHVVEFNSYPNSDFSAFLLLKDGVGEKYELHINRYRVPKYPKPLMMLNLIKKD